MAMDKKTKNILYVILGGLFTLVLLGLAVFGIISAVNAPKSDELSMNVNHNATKNHNGMSYNGTKIDYSIPDDYSRTQDLVPGNPEFLPPFQQALGNLPAMQHVDFQEEFPGTGIGGSAREGIDTITGTTLDSTNFGPFDDYEERVRATKGVGVSAIYSRGDNKGISLINQKSRMVDPTKMLPNVDPSRQSDRMVQAGPSIEAIGKRVPKAADIMRLLRASRGNGLARTIPRDKPPIYTEGLNAFRQTSLPSSNGSGGCTIGISPYEVSDLIDYTPNPFLNASRAVESGFNYTV